MIINISDTESIWFGQNFPAIDTERKISFTEGLYRVCEAAGYTREQIHDEFTQPGGAWLANRISGSRKPDKTEEQWVDSCRRFLEEFRQTTYEHPDCACIITRNPHAGIEAAQVATTLVKVYARK